MNKSIYVTQPHLPPLEEIIPYLKSTWESKILSNGGPFHEELEYKLCEYLGVEHIILCSNVRSSYNCPYRYTRCDSLSSTSSLNQSAGSSELVKWLSCRASSGKSDASLARSGPVVNTTNKLGGCCSDDWNQAAS